MRNWLLKSENVFEFHLQSREQVLKAISELESNGLAAPKMIPSKNSKTIKQYESNEERDFSYFLEFATGVAKYVEKPVKIDCVGANGKPASYTPDFLVYYADRPEFKNLKPTLFEVKKRKDIKKGWADLKPKFIAAMKFCDTKGWAFKIMTENELQAPYYQNAKFLYPYMRKSPDQGLIRNVLDALQELENDATPAHIIAIASKDFYGKAALIPALWHLIATRRIGCDLVEELTMNSSIWLNK